MHKVFFYLFLKVTREQFHVRWLYYLLKNNSKENMFAVSLALLKMIDSSLEFGWRFFSYLLKGTGD